jgi:trigger factor
VSPTETKDSCKRELQVEVPAEVVARETESLIQRYQKLARLPGFRRGHVPSTLIRQRFAEDIKTDIVENLVPRYFREEAEKQGLHPVSQPRITDLHIHEGEPLRFKASFEVLPEIEVTGYKELRVDKPDTSVSEQEVEDALKNLQEQQASYTPVEGRALADGDFAQVSFNGVPKEPGSKPVNVDEVMVEIGGANTMAEFNENLRGASAGEERTFDVTYAKDFNEERLAGKTFTYTVKVHGIKQKHLPERNDEFAKQVGEFASLEVLTKKVREHLEEDKKRSAEREGKEKLLDQLVQRHDFEVPEAMVERQVDVRLDRGLRALVAQGMRPEQVKKMDFDRLRAGQRHTALQEVKASLLLEKIADAENIQVDEQEVEKEVEAIALQAKQPVESVRARLTRDGALDRIRNRLRSEKTLDFLYNQSA